jgi:predicted TPR repeat methyltransferase
MTVARWILRNLPARRRAAVDIGCGTGVLAGKLAPHFAHVTGIDAGAGMAAAAAAHLAHDPAVAIRRCRFADFAAAAYSDETDLITMVAVLHLLDLDDTLARIPRLLAPGGRLLVVGLARTGLRPDVAVDLISAAARGHLPGATVRRRLFFRYTLRWDKPTAAQLIS